VCIPQQSNALQRRHPDVVRRSDCRAHDGAGLQTCATTRSATALSPQRWAETGTGDPAAAQRLSSSMDPTTRRGDCGLPHPP
jgi:hypothetical protein